MAVLTLVDEIEDWLSRQPFTKWADWDIKTADRRRKAAEWFAAQYESFESYRSGYAGDPGDGQLTADELAATFDQDALQRLGIDYEADHFAPEPDDTHCLRGCVAFFGVCRQKGCNGQAPPGFYEEQATRLRFEQDAINRLLGREPAAEDYSEDEAEKSLIQMVWGSTIGALLRR